MPREEAEKSKNKKRTPGMNKLRGKGNGQQKRWYDPSLCIRRKHWRGVINKPRCEFPHTFWLSSEGVSRTCRGRTVTL